MRASKINSIEVQLAVALVRQALEICDILELLEPACHLQMGLDLLEDPDAMKRVCIMRDLDRGR